LKRIDEGTYGTCASCGEQIRYERLEATPWVSLCIECKRKAEG
jgi:DnaK suppressor protein